MACQHFYVQDSLKILSRSFLGLVFSFFICYNIYDERTGCAGFKFIGHGYRQPLSSRVSNPWSTIWRSKVGGVMTMMKCPLRVSLAKVCRLGLIKDGKCGASKLRADRIKMALKWTGTKG